MFGWRCEILCEEIGGGGNGGGFPVCDHVDVSVGLRVQQLPWELAVRVLFNSNAEEKIGYERSNSNVLECISHTSYLAYTLRVVLPSEYRSSSVWDDKCRVGRDGTSCLARQVWTI